MNYKGKTALITGASSGIGAQFALQLHALGASFILVARRKELLDGQCQEFNKKRSGSASFQAIDLTDADQLGQLCDFVKKTQIDFLINNAGFGSFGNFSELDIKRELEMVALNVTAPLALLHAALPQMRERAAGSIIMVSSLVAFSPLPYMATYSATKSFEFVHAQAVREELRGSGISYLTLCPGPTSTEFGGVARVPGQVTSMQRDAVESVVAEALGALASGKAYVITGWQSKLLWLATRLIPVGLTTYLGKLMLRGSLPAKEKRTSA